MVTSTTSITGLLGETRRRRGFRLKPIGRQITMAMKRGGKKKKRGGTKKR